MAGNAPSLERKIEKLSRQQDAENSFEAITREWYQRRYDCWPVSYREEMMRTFEKDVFPLSGIVQSKISNQWSYSPFYQKLKSEVQQRKYARFANVVEKFGSMPL